MLNRSFLYGDGFFETIRKRNGQWTFLSEHLERATRSARILGMSWPENWNRDWLEHILKENQIANALDSIIRLTFYRAGGGTYAPQSNSIEVHLSAREVEPANDGIFISELSLVNISNQLMNLPTSIFADIYRENKKEINAWSELKTTSSLLFVEASRKSKDLEVDDLIILNQKGLVCECLSSNIVLLFQGQLFSPSSASGPVNGSFLSALKKLIEVKDINIQPEQLRFMDAILRCNAVRGLQRINLR